MGESLRAAPRPAQLCPSTFVPRAPATRRVAGSTRHNGQAADERNETELTDPRDHRPRFPAGDAVPFAGANSVVREARAVRDARLVHSATSYEGFGDDRPRLVQLFFFDVA